MKYVTGLDKVRSVFNRAPVEFQRRIAVALNRSLEEIKDAAETLGPVETGSLKREIQIEKRGLEGRKDGRAIVGRVIVGTQKGTAMEAFRQEFGRAPGPDGHPGHEPQTFFFTAYHAKRKRVRGRVARAVNAAARAMISGR